MSVATNFDKDNELYLCSYEHMEIYKIGVSKTPESRIKQATNQYIKRYNLKDKEEKDLTRIEFAILGKNGFSKPKLLCSIRTKYAYAIEDFILNSIYSAAKDFEVEFKQKVGYFPEELVKAEVFRNFNERTQLQINIVKKLSKLPTELVDEFGKIVLDLMLEETTKVQTFMRLDILFEKINSENKLAA